MTQSRKRVHRRPLNRQQRRKLRNSVRDRDRMNLMKNQWEPLLKRAVRWVSRGWKLTQIVETLLSLIDLL
jgi:hypothetical protein